ncbi:MAG: LysR family transcriptional regulator [Pseudomonadota bacterium]
MDLNWLDDVLVLLEEGNMTRAAERRNITQPAFSRRIRSFEDWLGKPILDRQANRVAINANLTSNEAEIRALVARIRDMRTNIANYEPVGTSVTIAAQHAPICSSFPNMLLRARTALPNMRIRLRAGNLNDCVSIFLRGDASMFLCHEAEGMRHMEFGDGVLRGRWGGDYLVPVVGGALRYIVNADGTIPEDTPAVVYPEDSHFGVVLRRAGRVFGSPSSTKNPVCVTAFSSGTLELVLNGIGVGWLPYSMAYRDIASGNLISLANALGQEALSILLFADAATPAAAALLDFWKRERPLAEA